MVLTHQHAVASVILVLSFAAAALLGFADVRAEEAAAARKGTLAGRKNPPLFEPGRKACWRRVYNAKHLAAHPRQNVTELTFLLRVSGYLPPPPKPDHIFYNFALSLKRRGDKRALATSRRLPWGKDRRLRRRLRRRRCHDRQIAERRRPVDQSRRQRHRLPRRMRHGEWNPDLMPGADDKVFHLDPAPEEACKTLERRNTSETGTREPRQ